MALDIDFHISSGVSIEDSPTFEAGSRLGFTAGLTYSIGEPFGLLLGLDGYWTWPVLTSEWVIYRGQVGGMASLGLQYDFGKLLVLDHSRIIIGASARLGAYQYTDIFLFYPGVFLGFHGDVLKLTDNLSLMALVDSDLWFRKDLDFALDIKAGAGLKWAW